jgi:hypothetical protein
MCVPDSDFGAFGQGAVIMVKYPFDIDRLLSYLYQAKKPVYSYCSVTGEWYIACHSMLIKVQAENYTTRKPMRAYLPTAMMDSTYVIDDDVLKPGKSTLQMKRSNYDIWELWSGSHSWFYDYALVPTEWLHKDVDTGVLTAVFRPSLGVPIILVQNTLVAMLAQPLDQYRFMMHHSWIGQKEWPAIKVTWRTGKSNSFGGEDWDQCAIWMPYHPKHPLDITWLEEALKEYQTAG